MKNLLWPKPDHFLLRQFAVLTITALCHVNKNKSQLAGQDNPNFHWKIPTRPWKADYPLHLRE